MGLKLKTPPAEEPITLQEAKEHLRVDLGADDAYIVTLVKASRQEAEDFMNRVLITQIWVLSLDEFPKQAGHHIVVPFPPLSAINSVKYFDLEGMEQTWDSAKYKADTASQPGRLFPAFDEVWPSARDQANAVTIEFEAGYGAAVDVPETIVQGIKLILGARYDNRGAGAMQMPDGAKALLSNHQDLRF
jgi:uncharacterized phiE125 gp8 family phage protein